MKFDIHKGRDGQWYWRAGPANGGRKTADGSEGYATRANATRACWRHINSIRQRTCTVAGRGG